MTQLETAGNVTGDPRIHFGIVISNAGFSVEDFPIASQHLALVFDEKGKQRNMPLKSDLHYAKELFIENSGSKEAFRELLSSQLNSNQEITGLEVTITRDRVMVRWDYCSRVRSFSRMPPQDPWLFCD